MGCGLREDEGNCCRFSGTGVLGRDRHLRWKAPVLNLQQWVGIIVFLWDIKLGKKGSCGSELQKKGGGSVALTKVSVGVVCEWGGGGKGMCLGRSGSNLTLGGGVYKRAGSLA